MTTAIIGAAIAQFIIGTITFMTIAETHGSNPLKGFMLWVSVGVFGACIGFFLQ
jgi:hypothetical protein